MLFRSVQFLFYRAKQREANAKALKFETDNISSFADEWRELFIEQKEENKIKDNKIDELRKVIETDRRLILKITKESMDKDTIIAILTAQKCTKRGCSERVPPSEY